MTETIPLNEAEVSKADVYCVTNLDVTSGILFDSLIKFYFYEAQELSKGAIRGKMVISQIVQNTQQSFRTQDTAEPWIKRMML